MSAAAETGEGPVLLTVSCPTPAIAARIAGEVVRARLAASANWIPGFRSTYRWQGKVETAEETLLRCKTRAGCLSDLITLIRRHHPYELPAITWTELGADPETASWIAESTAQA